MRLFTLVVSVSLVCCSASTEPTAPADASAPDVHEAASPVGPPDGSADTLSESDATSSPTGSFNLTFDEAELDTPDGLSKAVSEHMVARLDLRASGGHLLAAMTAPYAPPSVMQVERHPDRLVLTGTCVVGRARCSKVDEVWNEVVLPLDEDGAFDGTFEAEGIGARTQVNNASGFPVAMHGSGRVDADARAPHPRLRWHPWLEGVGILPWSRLKVDLREGVEEESLDLHTHAFVENAQSQTEMPVRWLSREVGTAGETWPGLWSAQLGLVDWDLAQEGAMHVKVGPGLVDPAGNPSVLVASEVPVVSVGPAVSGYDFATLPAVTGAWGPSAVLTEPEVCESAGCLLLGPISIDLGSSWGAGFAGRVSMNGATRIALRYRMLCSQGPGACEDVLVHAVASDTAEPIEASGTALATTELPFGPFAFASDWQEVVVDLPASSQAEEVGLSVRASRTAWDLSETSMACGIDNFPKGYVKGIVLQSIRVLQDGG